MKSNTITDGEKIKELLTRGVAEVIEKEHCEQALRSGRRLRVKYGVDPTAPDLHLGHSVQLRKLRQFQEFGHQVIFLIGDYTAKIGDPSGRSKTRPMLSDADIKKNLKTFIAQAGIILDTKKVEIRHNSEWYATQKVSFFLELASKITVARVLERDDFQKRLIGEQDISMLELLYPLLQGYDSVALKADIEIGGADQKFNLLMGRRVQKKYELPEQDVITTPLLEGLDGVRKMSKSLGNYVGLTGAPTEMFGKIMSLPDALVEKYFLLATDLPTGEAHALMEHVGPRDAKARLAFEIVKLYHGEKAARKAQEQFDAQFRDKGMPQDIPSYTVCAEDKTIADILVHSNTVSSKSEVMRLITQHGVKVHVDENEPHIITSSHEMINARNYIIQVGKRRYVRVVE